MGLNACISTLHSCIHNHVRFGPLKRWGGWGEQFSPTKCNIIERQYSGQLLLAEDLLVLLSKADTKKPGDLDNGPSAAVS